MQLSLSVHLPTGSDVVFDLDPLAHAVDVSASSHRVLQPKIELKLKKKEGGVKWNKLEGEDESIVKMGAFRSASTVFRPACVGMGSVRRSTRGRSSHSRAGQATEEKVDHSYPSSSRKRHNWDDIVKQSAKEDEALAEELRKNPNAGGDKALNELFQKLYADATDDQRRAMIKSYQESNGTALSTDWKDVSKVRDFAPPRRDPLTLNSLAEEGRDSSARLDGRQEVRVPSCLRAATATD